MSDEVPKRGDCPHPNAFVDKRRHDGNHTVCHLCHSHIIVNVAHYANGLNADEQYRDLVAKMNKASIEREEPIRLPNGVLGVCTNCEQWQYRHSDGIVDCFNECRRRGIIK